MRAGRGIALARCVTAATVALALGLGCSEPLRAQSGLLGPGAAFLGVGASGLSTGDLDERLAARGYPTFGRSAVAINVGAYRIFSQRLLLGGEWHGLIIGDEVHDGWEVGVGGGYGTIGVGYVVQVSSRARVYPRIGLGGGGLGLWFVRDSVVDFDDVLAEPKATLSRTPVLSNFSAVVDLGGGAEFFLRRRGSGALVGVRVGYLTAPGADWHMYDADVRGGPEASIAGPYVRATVGIGWRR